MLKILWFVKTPPITFVPRNFQPLQMWCLLEYYTRGTPSQKTLPLHNLKPKMSGNKLEVNETFNGN